MSCQLEHIQTIISKLRILRAHLVQKDMKTRDLNIRGDLHVHALLEIAPEITKSVVLLGLDRNGCTRRAEQIPESRGSVSSNSIHPTRICRAPNVVGVEESIRRSLGSRHCWSGPDVLRSGARESLRQRQLATLVHGRDSCRHIGERPPRICRSRRCGSRRGPTRLDTPHPCTILTRKARRCCTSGQRGRG